MQELKNKAKEWIEKLRKTTQMFLDLPHDIKLPNSWGKRELAIHFLGWDEVMIGYSKEIIKGKPFIWDEFFQGDINKTNKQFLDEHSNLTREEAIDKFKQVRSKILNIYKEILENHFQDDKRLLDYYSMWGHDVHHLKQAGINTQEIEN